METIEAWHFARQDRCLAFGDGRKIVKGRTLTVEGKPILGNHGLHASRKITDALKTGYGGSIICRVEVGGEIIEGGSILAGQTRKCLWWIDASKLLHEFACKCAARALKKTNFKKTSKSWKAINIKRKWLAGKATDRELEDARSAAAESDEWREGWSSVKWTARSEASSAAVWAAWYGKTAAKSASVLATTAAAYSVHSSRSAGPAAKSAEKDWQEKTLLRMIEKEAS